MDFSAAREEKLKEMCADIGTIWGQWGTWVPELLSSAP
jgi:hypothetical protein